LVGALSTIIWANIHGLSLMISERLMSFTFAFLSVIFVSIYYEKKSDNRN
jgi:hypothetical protein